MGVGGDASAGRGNAWCLRLGIAQPDLARVREHREANAYALLIVALLEHGAPLTLAEVAERFAAAGVASRERALLSLKRCKPARAPVYRDGDRYALDLHDDELDLWLFRLGLRPPRSAPPRPAPPPPPPQPPLHEPLSPEELAAAWKGYAPWSFSAQRLAVAILDAHGGSMDAGEAIAFAKAHAGPRLSPESAVYWRKGAPVRATPDGRWVLDRAHVAVAAARKAVRERVELERKWASSRPDPAALEANRREWERRRTENAIALARLRRAVVHAFPPAAPQAAVLIDVADRTIERFVAHGEGSALGELEQRLTGYEVIVGLGVRGTLRGLGFDAGERRLVNLAPPQKSLRLNRHGRALKITTALLIQGSCGISRPLADAATLRRHLRAGDLTRLVRRLEADARSLFRLYEYGRLHGFVRLRWGFLDEALPAPWAHRDETRLYDLCRLALELGTALEIVAGSTPGWTEPWAHLRRCRVQRDGHWDFALYDERGIPVDPWDVQLARLEEIQRTLH